MTKDVLIKISGIQFMEEQPEAQEPIEVITKGEYYYRNEKHYLKYEEVAEGAEGVSNCTVKFQEDSFELLKKGSSNVHMVFETGKKNMTYYTTPFGTIQMRIAATNLALDESKDSLNMKVDYALDMNEEHIADCYLMIQVQPRDCENFSL